MSIILIRIDDLKQFMHRQGITIFFSDVDPFLSVSLTVWPSAPNKDNWVLQIKRFQIIWNFCLLLRSQVAWFLWICEKVNIEKNTLKKKSLFTQYLLNFSKCMVLKHMWMTFNMSFYTNLGKSNVANQSLLTKMLLSTQDHAVVDSLGKV